MQNIRITPQTTTKQPSPSLANGVDACETIDRRPEFRAGGGNFSKIDRPNTLPIFFAVTKRRDRGGGGAAGACGCVRGVAATAAAPGGPFADGSRPNGRRLT
ncbi:hypothetical protein GEV33_005336 [Tenebrio molitor]|uniref:Uncharacterized protein n=1 Tax=Tenebrio molitor TaxID=7067 RepID=A0A8J6HMR5_TENMO|nr:hypothetical protein GEV33_005336 [Tenebrio molitor]